MPRLDLNFLLRVGAITLALLFQCEGSSWATAPDDEICDVNADSALGLENYPASIGMHRKFLRTHNDNALAHYHLGFAYGMTGHSTDEIIEYLTAARLGLHKWDLYLNLGLAYLGQNDGLEAIETLQTAVSFGPDHPEAHFNLAIAYERSNRLLDALQQITASLLLAPLDPDQHNTKAIICAKAGDLVCAREEWTHLVQVAPYYTPATVNLTILGGSRIPLVGSTSSRLNDSALEFVR